MALFYADLAASVLYANAWLRGDPSVLANNRQGQAGLWRYAISGDLPIVLLRIADAADIELVRQLSQAHAWWRLHGLAVDLVVQREQPAVSATSATRRSWMPTLWRRHWR